MIPVERGMKAVKELADFASFPTDRAEKIARWMAGISDEQHAYMCGMDYYLNGVQNDNCHFSLFTTRAMAKAWEQGKDDAEKGVHGGMYVPSHRKREP